MLCGASIAAFLAFLTAAAPTTAPATRTSSWGPRVRGVQARIESPASVEQNAWLTIRIELRAVPGELPHGVTRLDTFLFPAWTELILKNVRNGKTFRVTPHDPSLGMPVSDPGSSFIRLDGNFIDRREVTFPLRSAGEGLEPGEYDCSFRYTTTRINKQWLASRAPSGFWAGEVQSASVRLTVVAEKPKVRTARVPLKLRLMDDHTIRFAAEDAHEVSFPVRNGTFFGTRISRADGAVQLMSGFVAAGAVAPIDDWDISPPTRGTATYTIEFFETPLPPQHHWAPFPQSEGYQTLWTGTFKVSE